MIVIPSAARDHSVTRTILISLGMTIIGGKW